MPSTAADDSTQVFCNCPFDGQYEPLFRAMIFTIYDCGFTPRCALEVEDSAENRLSKIRSIIKQSRLGVHDISRVQLTPSGLPRFNMPFELGYFLGAKAFGPGRQKRKACIVFDSKRYRYQEFLSDIAGQDIYAHANRPKKLIEGPRTFLNAQSPEIVPGPRSLSSRFSQFQRDLPTMCRQIPIDPNELGFIDYSAMVTDWLQRRS